MIRALALCLLLSGCLSVQIESKTTGDFCDVARPMKYAAPEIAELLVGDDPRLARQIASHNLYGEAVCGWEFGE